MESTEAVILSVYLISAVQFMIRFIYHFVHSFIRSFIKGIFEPTNDQLSPFVAL